MRRRTVWLILLSCAVPRLLALAVFPHPQQTLYYAIASNILAGRGYTLFGDAATYLEPAYPSVLAAGGFVAGTGGMLALQLAVGCAGGIPLYLVTRRRAGERTAWMAISLYAVSPYLARQTAAFMEVTLATTLAIVVVWSVDVIGDARARAAVAVRAAAAGVALALLLLTRFSFLPVALGAIFVAGARNGGVAALQLSAVITAAIVPWLLYSRAVSGDLLPQRMGENLFVTTTAFGDGIVPRINTDVLQPAAHELAFSALGADATTGQRDRFLLRQSLEYARAHPLHVLALKLRNAAAILQPRLVPFTELRGRAFVVNGTVEIPPQGSRPLSFEIAAGGFQALLLAGGAIGAWKRRSELLRADAMLTLVVTSIAVVNVAFFPTSRLLAPMTFVLMFYAAYGFSS